MNQLMRSGAEKEFNLPRLHMTPFEAMYTILNWVLTASPIQSEENSCKNKYHHVPPLEGQSLLYRLYTQHGAGASALLIGLWLYSAGYVQQRAALESTHVSRYL